MGSIKSNLMLDELSPKDPNGCINIYAILYGNELHVSAIDVNFSLIAIKEKFLDHMVSKEMKTLSPTAKKNPAIVDAIRKSVKGENKMTKDDQGRWSIQPGKSAIRAALQVLYEEDTGRLHLAGGAYSPGIAAKNNQMAMQEKLMNGIAKWIAVNYEKDIKDLRVVSGIVPFRDYEIFKMSDYPGIYSIAKRVGVNLDVNNDIDIFLANYSNDRVKTLLNDQLGDVDGTFICTDRDFTYVDDKGDKVFELNPPFIVVNSHKKNTPIIMREIILSLVENKALVDIDAEKQRSRNIPSVVPDSERDEIVEEVMNNVKSIKFKFLQDSIRIKKDSGMEMLDTMHTSFEYTNGIPITKEIKRAMDRYNIKDDSPADIKNFFKTFFLFRKMYDPSESPDIYNKTFYYIVKRDLNSPIQYEKLFNELFYLYGNYPLDGKPDKFYQIAISKYSFPEKVMQMFGIEFVGDQKVFDEKTRMLTKSINYANRDYHYGGPRDPDYNVVSGAMDEAVSKVARAQYGAAGEIDNRVDAPVSVRSLSSFPFAYSEVKQMFDDRGLPYQDIKIVMVNDSSPSMRGVLGGFVPKESPDLYSELGSFTPPVILLNIYNRFLRKIDNLSEVIIHEGAHWLDSLLVEEGIEDSSIMYNPERARPGDLEDLIRYLRQYLHESPTEFNAHSMEAYSHLKLVDLQYLRSKRYYLKERLLGQLYMDTNEERIPLVKDASAGDVDVYVSPSDLVGIEGQVDLVDNNRSPQKYYETGVKEFETKNIVGAHSTSGTIRFEKPLASSFLIANGAAIISPATQPLELVRVKKELYSKIIDNAFDMAIRNSEKDVEK